jgi:hypothetical protein
MADNSSPDYKALFHKAEEEQQRAEDQEKEEAELQRQVEDQEKQEAELRRQAED